jgi:tRNA A-37 threonylcarbamoyl transferase component Bud32
VRVRELLQEREPELLRELRSERMLREQRLLRLLQQ